MTRMPELVGLEMKSCAGEKLCEGCDRTWILAAMLYCAECNQIHMDLESRQRSAGLHEMYEAMPRLDGGMAQWTRAGALADLVIGLSRRVLVVGTMVILIGFWFAVVKLAMLGVR